MASVGLVVGWSDATTFRTGGLARLCFLSKKYAFLRESCSQGVESLGLAVELMWADTRIVVVKYSLDFSKGGLQPVGAYLLDLLLSLS